MHVQVVEAFLFLFVYVVEHIVTFGFSKMHSARVRGLARLRNLLMSQGGAWDFVPVKLCTSRQSAAVGQTDAGKSSRTLAPFHVAGRARLAVWR